METYADEFISALIFFARGLNSLSGELQPRVGPEPKASESRTAGQVAECGGS